MQRRLLVPTMRQQIKALNLKNRLKKIILLKRAHHRMNLLPPKALHLKTKETRKIHKKVEDLPSLMVQLEGASIQNAISISWLMRSFSTNVRKRKQPRTERSKKSCSWKLTMSMLKRDWVAVSRINRYHWKIKQLKKRKKAFARMWLLMFLLILNTICLQKKSAISRVGLLCNQRIQLVFGSEFMSH